MAGHRPGRGHGQRAPLGRRHQDQGAARADHRGRHQDRQAPSYRSGSGHGHRAQVLEGRARLAGAGPGPAKPDALVLGNIEGRFRHPETFSKTFTKTVARCRRDLGDDAVPAIRLHDLRHTHATILQMSGVASGASFGRSSERALPAVQRAALEQARSHRSECTLRDLGCHHPLASSRTMMQPVRLQRMRA